MLEVTARAVLSQAVFSLVELPLDTGVKTEILSEEIWVEGVSRALVGESHQGSW